MGCTYLDSGGAEPGQKSSSEIPRLIKVSIRNARRTTESDASPNCLSLFSWRNIVARPGALQPADTLSHSPFACFKPAIQVSSADFTVRTARLISLTLLERWHLVLRSVAARSNSSYERCSK